MKLYSASLQKLSNVDPSYSVRLGCHQERQRAANTRRLSSHHQHQYTASFVKTFRGLFNKVYSSVGYTDPLEYVLSLTSYINIRNCHKMTKNYNYNYETNSEIILHSLFHIIMITSWGIYRFYKVLKNIELWKCRHQFKAVITELHFRKANFHLLTFAPWIDSDFLLSHMNKKFWTRTF